MECWTRWRQLEKAAGASLTRETVNERDRETEDPGGDRRRSGAMDVAHGFRLRDGGGSAVFRCVAAARRASSARVRRTVQGLERVGRARRGQARRENCHVRGPG